MNAPPPLRKTAPVGKPLISRALKPKPVWALLAASAGAASARAAAARAKSSHRRLPIVRWDMVFLSVWFTAGARETRAEAGPAPPFVLRIATVSTIEP